MSIPTFIVLIHLEYTIGITSMFVTLIWCIYHLIMVASSLCYQVSKSMSDLSHA